MCADGNGSHLEDAVGECPECGAQVDIDGDSVEESCNYPRYTCKTCGDAPCDGGC